MTPHVSEYDHDKRLFPLSQVDSITNRNAAENILALGAIGSGKSSGVNYNISRALFASGAGGICLTGKSEDVAFYVDLAKECGRENDIILVDPQSGWGLNFLRFEDEREGKGAGQLENLVAILSELQEVAARKPGHHDSKGDIWKAAADDLLRAAVSTVKMATGKVTLRDIAELIRTAPRREEVQDEAFLQNSQCVKWLIEAEQNALASGNPAKNEDSRANSEQLMSGFARLAPETGESVVFNISIITSVFGRSPLRDLWCGDLMNLRPELTFGDDGTAPKIIIFNIPTLEWGAKIGGFSQILYKKIWQDAVLRRDITDSSRLCFCIADECHEVYSSSDSRFVSLSRGKRACTFYLTQNISNLRAVVGNEDLLDSFLSNMGLKCFCANNGPTNKYMSELIGIQETLKPSWSRGENQNGDDGSRSNKSMSFSYDKDFHIRPDDIYGLKRGSPDDDGIVECVAFAGGRPFAGNRGLPWLKVSFLADWKRRQQLTGGRR